MDGGVIYPPDAKIVLDCDNLRPERYSKRLQ
jgi:hypothetical protein